MPRHDYFELYGRADEGLRKGLSFYHDGGPLPHRLHRHGDVDHGRPSEPKAALQCYCQVREEWWMDEMGYISGAQTCIFGSGFEDVVDLHPNTKLMSVKTSNNTNSYTGDMGLCEINAALLPADAERVTV